MKKVYQSISRWFANSDIEQTDYCAVENKIDWIRALPFILLNVSCLCVFLVGFSWAAFFTALALCYIRVFSIGAFYHRYFSHRAYKTNRFWQLIFAILGATAVQRGPLWWAGHHRRHHTCSDQKEDAHSPVHHGFFWSHIGWFLSEQHYKRSSLHISDLTKYPELVFLDKYDNLIPLIFAILVFTFGVLLNIYSPGLHTNGWQMLVWGFSISTALVFQITVSINSIAHRFGKKAYNTKDNSRNHWLLALITLGEGWHNNHHYYPSSAKQGFHFWQIDITYYILCGLEKIGIIWDIKHVPNQLLTNSN